VNKKWIIYRDNKKLLEKSEWDANEKSGTVWVRVWMRDIIK